MYTRPVVGRSGVMEGLRCAFCVAVHAMTPEECDSWVLAGDGTDGPVLYDEDDDGR